ncbi:hypothetical protein HETIRDRAFT_323145 [Heterobasidion irregulare TC 32-1]|uniref:Uncharacterized protein n=1 Tax=Heterobasidion irregulare (strain TC 32-1) TaxID=747525 RepID=W4K1Z7_HETIT|nr:uncharacterized protein HETIRDRAFT_323145 [Heterobasidion irregulare TC 32-1]ETW79131.1 hypothetical protein HETIRDRAFT_323145 [Heterobasidion irregulare TC 32-1]
MPPQPGMFAIPYASAHKVRASNNLEVHNGIPDMNMAYHHHSHHHPNQLSSSTMIAGPSSRVHVDDSRREKRRKEIAGRLGREMTREDMRHYTEAISTLHSTALQLAAQPEKLPAYQLRLYSLSLERSALLAQAAVEEKYALDTAQAAYEFERERIEEEWKRGRNRIRERMLEGVEDRRRRARDDKDADGVVGGETSLDSQSRPIVTRKLRNKLGTSPPPTPQSTNANGSLGSISMIAGLLPNPHSLSVDELPSPFPLSLTSAILTNAPSGGSGSNGRRRAKGGGSQPQAAGKSEAGLVSCKESELESDLGEIRRGNRRRRTTTAVLSKT